MYLHSLFLLLSWPLTILVSWLIARYMITAWEKKEALKEKKAGEVS
jgi:hypothetical protein